MPQLSDIAVIGVSALFPGSVDKTGFWRNIEAGNDLLSDVPATHWLIDDYYDPDPSKPDMTYAKRGGFLPEVDFDPMAWGIPPSIVPATDSAQLLALIVAQRVLEDAWGDQFAAQDKEKMSVILGVTSAQELLGSMVSRLQHPVWRKSLREAGLPEDQVQEIVERMRGEYADWQESTFPGLLGNVVAGRIANRLDLRGTNCVTDAACASTLSALSMGIGELQLGQSDVVIAGGVDTMNDIFMYMCFSKTPAMSPTGDCRPFSDQADGTMLGEGLCMLALKRLEDAERDKDRVYAVIRAVGSSSDGRSKSVYAPLAEGQARALRRAYERAGYGPDTVELIEAHGTGTKAGDAAEFGGLCDVFDDAGRADRQWCALGSVKSQVGHTKAAAGAAGLFKAVMALHHKVLPPTIKIERPNPGLDLENSPFYLNTAARPWVRDGSHPRRASVSSFGFGGSNFHVALEEYTGSRQAWRLRTSPTELVLLSAAEPAALAQTCRELHTDSLERTARQTQAAFDPSLPARAAIVASDTHDLRVKLDRLVAWLDANGEPLSTPDGVFYATGAEPGQVGFLFPGQGSQYLDMGADVAMALDAARSAWDEAAALSFDGTGVHHVVFPPPVFDYAQQAANEARLTATRWAQPALGVASLALLRVLDEVGVKPACVGGHSFGEVTALHAAGVLSAADVVRVARRRGELMEQAASTPGAMCAVAASVESVRPRLDELGLVVANHNAPDQVVLSGTVDAVDTAVERFVADGVTARRLPVATAFHSEIVAPSSGPFLAFLGDVDIGEPSIDVFANATAAPYPADAQAIRQGLADQVASPVRFVEQVEAMYARGVRTFVEVGPGQVLTRLVGRILGDRPHTAVALDRRGKHGVTSLQEGLGRLAVAGVPVALAPLWAPFAEVPRAEHSDTPRLTLAINGANHGKPYPPPGGAAALPRPNPVRRVNMATEDTPAANPRPAAPAAAQAPAAPPQASIQAPAATPVAAPLPAPAPAATAGDAWVQAYQETQRQTVEAHAAFQRAMADSHSAFLRTVEASFAGLSSMMTGQPVPLSAAPIATAPVPPTHPIAPPLPAPAPVVPAVAPPTPAPPVAAAPAAAPVPQATPAPAAALDVTGLLLSVVAEKTGYPADMLGLHMALEADLGIDSIKRVEILSAMREQAPELPEVDAKEMAELGTLGEIVAYMGRFVDVAAPAPAPAAGLDVTALLMDVVADKTGYPADMLGLHMALEADLGIDSIKRVEILSAMRERAPELPEVDAQEMAELGTLGEIVTYMGRFLGDAPPPPKAAGEVDVEALLMDVVADKTGYPADMLGLHMALEADLGIDSIKRVEILSAMRERAPALPEVDAQEMATLSTLGEIVTYMHGHLGGGSAPAAISEPEMAQADIGRFEVHAVTRPAPGLTVRGLWRARRLVVTDDGGGVAARVAARLVALGRPAEVVSEVPPDADAVLFLGGLRDLPDVDAAIAVNREAFKAARSAAAGVAEGLWVTVQDTGGRLGLDGSEPVRAWSGGLTGLTKTIALEWPGASARALDVARDGRDAGQVAEAIVRELLTGGADAEVGLPADGSRVVPVCERAHVVPDGVSLGSGDVVVASGGARGVTAAALVALARATGARFALLGRTALADEPAACAGAHGEAALKRALLEAARDAGQAPSPAELGAQVRRILANREIRDTVAAIADAGGRARYVAADVTDPAGLAQALAEVRADWGPVTAVVHGAGVVADKHLADKTDDQFDRVFDTKVAGLRALLGACADDPLEVLCLFSSVAGRTGNVGQSDYAMANEVLNKVAAAQRHLRGPGCKVVSIGWGPWRGGMVTPGLEAHFQRMGVSLIPLDVGADAFVDEVLGASDAVEVVVGGAPGDGPLGADGERRLVAEIHVDVASHPWLADHTIAEVPVVPAVVALEWLARAALALRPDLSLTAIRELKVLRGIQLDGWAKGGDTLVLEARQVSNGDGALLAVDLSGGDGKVHYSAVADLHDGPPVPGALPEVGRLDPWRATVYDGHVLFHGPAFHVIRAVEGVSDAGLAGTLEGLSARGWPSERWVTDPAALDGALQLAVLWARHVLGGATLPTRLDAFVVHAPGPWAAPLHCVVRRREAHPSRVVSDVALVGPDGDIVAELRGLETHLRPGERRSETPAGRPRA